MACDNSVEVKETLKKIKKYLECPICLELLVDPYTTQCGHSFCRYCIHTFIATTKNTKCPLCKVLITKRSINKSTCLADIIDSVQHLEEAMQMDIGVLNTPPATTGHSHECSATPGLIIHSLLHPTPFKPTTIPQVSTAAADTAPADTSPADTSSVIQRKTKSNIRKANSKRRKNVIRKTVTTDTSTSSSSRCTRGSRPVIASPEPSDLPSSSKHVDAHYCTKVDEEMESTDDRIIIGDVQGTRNDMVPLMSHTWSAHVEQSSEHLDLQSADHQRAIVDQQDILSASLFTTPSPDVYVSAAADVIKQDDHLLEEESPTPVLQQDVPVCHSTPDKMEFGSPGARKQMSRSPSIPLQNTSRDTAQSRVEMTPIVLPQREVALEGLYEADSPDSVHSRISFDLFDDPVIPCSQSKHDDRVNIVTVDSPVLFTTDHHQSSGPLHNVQSDSAMDTLPSLSTADSISTQEIMKLQQQLEQKQNEIASLDAAILEKSVLDTDKVAQCSKSSVTLPSSGETVIDSLPANTSPSCQPEQSPITPSTQMNTVALFQCADQILSGLKKTLRKDRALTPIDTNVVVEDSECVSEDKLFHTPATHRTQVTRPSSDQPRYTKLSLATHKRLNNSAELIPANNVHLTTSGLTRTEIQEVVQKLTEVCGVQYSNRLSSDTTHLVMATSNKICTRTPKYLQGLLRGLWIISYDWVMDSLRCGVLLDEVEYEVAGDMICASNIPHTGRLAKLQKTNGILSSYSVVLIGEMKEIGTRALTSLILLAGGVPSLTCSADISKYKQNDHVIMLCDPGGLEQSELDVIRSNKAPIVNLDWLLDTISHYRIQPLDNYLAE